MRMHSEQQAQLIWFHSGLVDFFPDLLDLPKKDAGQATARQISTKKITHEFKAA